MKKKISLTLFTLALFAIVLVAAQQPLTGDANNDGIVNLLDATCVATDIGNTTSSCVGDGADSDVNGDGQIDMKDLELVRDAYRE